MTQPPDQADGLAASKEIAKLAMAEAALDETLQAQREAHVDALIAAGGDPANDPNF